MLEACSSFLIWGCLLIDCKINLKMNCGQRFKKKKNVKFSVTEKNEFPLIFFSLFFLFYFLVNIFMKTPTKCTGYNWFLTRLTINASDPCVPHS